MARTRMTGVDPPETPKVQAPGLRVLGSRREMGLNFALLSGIWGCSFWWIKLGLRWLPSPDVAFARSALGAAFLLTAAFATRARLPRGRRIWGHLAVVGLLFSAAPFTLFSFGETRVSAVLAGLINAMAPLVTLLAVVLFFREEKVGVVKLIGLAVGFAGALVVVAVWDGLGKGELLGVVACLVAVSCYGVAYPYSRRHLAGRPEGAISLMAGQLLCATLLSLPLALLAGTPDHSPAVPSLLGLIGLGTLGSGLANALNIRLVGNAGGTTASTVSYTSTAVAVAVGAVFLGEAVHWFELVGGVLILAGALLAQKN